MTKTFHIFTIANDRANYTAMRDSFLNAGFSEDRCTYTLFDNGGSNIHDPYAVISAVSLDTDCEFAIVCHQDVRVDRGDDFQSLLSRLRELGEKHRDWGVAGNAGVDDTGRTVLRITDPYGVFAAAMLPRQVLTLDENFLVLRPRRGFGCSPGLSGFHMYGADLCFNAMASGSTCHVIDFHLTHLSAGNTAGHAFELCYKRFNASWAKRLWIGIAETSTYWPLRISKLPGVARMLQSRRLVERLRRRQFVFKVIRKEETSADRFLRLVSAFHFLFDAAIAALAAVADRIRNCLPSSLTPVNSML